MRLVTRSDFDGLVTAVLFRKLGMIDDMKFVHPKDMQDGLVEITSNDILTNVPFIEGCGLWFDHHASELKRSQEEGFTYEGEIRIADSAARVVYDFYGGRDKFGPFFDSIMEGVDKADAAKFSREDILNPQGWDLLSFIMDSRTGLGRYRDFRISNYQLMEKLVGLCLEQSLEEIMQDEDVRQRVERYFELDALFRDMLIAHTRVEGNAIITDLRGVETIYPGNRFLVYALHPEQNVSLWIVDGFQKQNCAIACGHSIVNRSCGVQVGYLMREFGGGGHEAAGTCQVSYESADEAIEAIIQRFN
ncbi:exopolyphosphatase [Paenibacillus lignilyticus]|uniref:Exopolyphosphatase n=1 Tax=Paenibacillus lignilyticus TaxID=1172615 RepID=A0ABS5CCN8_9BACL|nr:exopolyphosphatase [Paenibacillus lignilyticus]MBP3961572.1 exopolyphosphatase [Paenibacillus lignilyticus]MBP3963758.1 exopolyphosphatase [Paenibacillus lignilyticus]